jgi:hypothetical protein
MALKISIDYQHVLIAAGAALSGAALGYLTQQNPVTFLASFDSWAHTRPIAIGLGYAEVLALLAMAKKGFVLQSPEAPPAVPGKVEFLARSVPPPRSPIGLPTSFPKTEPTVTVKGTPGSQ